jgi:hypothetical protein
MELRIELLSLEFHATAFAPGKTLGIKGNERTKQPFDDCVVGAIFAVKEMLVLVCRA